MKKRFLPIGLAVVLAVFATACTSGQPADPSQTPSGEETAFTPSSTHSEPDPARTEADPAQSEAEPPSADAPAPAESSGGKTLVAVFSATGNTRSIAESAAGILGADLYEIIPQEPYTEADLDYYTDCRADREQSDDTARPAISGDMENMEDYDTVLIGYPIWHGGPPKIIYTFLESYDFSGKTVLPFCTSGGSPYSDSGIRGLVGSDTVWLTGRRFAAKAAQDEVSKWLEETGLLSEPDRDTLFIEVNGQTLRADLSDNSSSQTLREILAEGPLTVSMSDYGNMEKVGPLGADLPRNDEQITTGPGDIILYQGNKLVIYYDQNSWNFTRLGKLRDVDAQELRDILGAGDVSVTLSLGG